LVVRLAARKAHTNKLPRRTAGAAMTVTVFAKARLRQAGANPEFYEGHHEGCCEHCDQGWHYRLTSSGGASVLFAVPSGSPGKPLRSSMATSATIATTAIASIVVSKGFLLLDWTERSMCCHWLLVLSQPTNLPVCSSSEEYPRIQIQTPAYLGSAYACTLCSGDLRLGTRLVSPPLPAALESARHSRRPAPGDQSGSQGEVFDLPCT
jgi:hypothetical protein